MSIDYEISQRAVGLRADQRRHLTVCVRQAAADGTR